jgi:hypothetical protein
MELAIHASRDRWLAATRRHAASSVASVASGYARFLRPYLACVSPPATTICLNGEL